MGSNQHFRRRSDHFQKKPLELLNKRRKRQFGSNGAEIIKFLLKLLIFPYYILFIIIKELLFEQSHRISRWINRAVDDYVTKYEQFHDDLHLQKLTVATEESTLEIHQFIVRSLIHTMFMPINIFLFGLYLSSEIIIQLIDRIMIKFDAFCQQVYSIWLDMDYVVYQLKDHLSRLKENIKDTTYRVFDKDKDHGSGCFPHNHQYLPISTTEDAFDQIEIVQTNACRYSNFTLHIPTLIQHNNNEIRHETRSSIDATTHFYRFNPTHRQRIKEHTDQQLNNYFRTFDAVQPDETQRIFPREA